MDIWWDLYLGMDHVQVPAVFWWRLSHIWLLKQAVVWTLFYFVLAIDPTKKWPEILCGTKVKEKINRKKMAVNAEHVLKEEVISWILSPMKAMYRETHGKLYRIWNDGIWIQHIAEWSPYETVSSSLEELRPQFALKIGHFLCTFIQHLFPWKRYST